MWNSSHENLIALSNVYKITSPTPDKFYRAFHISTIEPSPKSRQDFTSLPVQYKHTLHTKRLALHRLPFTPPASLMHPSLTINALYQVSAHTFTIKCTRPFPYSYLCIMPFPSDHKLSLKFTPILYFPRSLQTLSYLITSYLLSAITAYCSCQVS